MEQTPETKSSGNKILDLIYKLYGGINMTWPKVLLLAVGSAVITAIFLLVPIFKNTSFERMGVFYEAWVFLAIFIMANCKKPLECALKVFVFFLVSQPLIYLIEVPFVEMGWGLFGYYRFWFILTLLTFPAAFFGWFINKKNWLSVVILSPIFVALSAIAFGAFQETAKHFPNQILTGILCILHMVIYCIAFFPDAAKKIVGGVIIASTFIVAFIFRQPSSIEMVTALPGSPSFSDDAVIKVDAADKVNIQFQNTQEGLVYVKSEGFGSTDFVVTDGDTEVFYRIDISDDDGTADIVITENGDDEDGN